MPVGLNSLELQAWYKLPEQLFGKSIQHSFRFFVTLFDNPLSRLLSKGGKISTNGPMPIIRSYHVTNVTIPHYEAEPIVQVYGQVPRSFPSLKTEEPLKVTISFEEDENGTIAYLVNWLQRSIMRKDGLYNNPVNMKFGFIAVEIQDKNGIPVVYYVFHDPYFLGTSNPTYDYNSNDAIKYDITFGVDRVSTYFTKYNPIGGAITAIKGLKNLGKK